MERLDQALVNRKIVSGRDRASDEIKKGLVKVNNKIVSKPSFKVNDEDEIIYSGNSDVISRAQLKLKKAVDFFNVDINGKLCLDVGASTGGFTKVLLENGAKKVVALDVGHDQLHESLKNDSRVINLEGYNFKNINLDDFKEKIDVISMDVSFISILKLIPSLKLLMSINTKTKLLILIKPQFEAGKKAINSQGIVKKKEDHIRVIREIFEGFSSENFNIIDIVSSPIKGSDGNIEYLMYIDGLKTKENDDNIDIKKYSEKIVLDAFSTN